MRVGKRKERREALGDVAKGLETVEWACSMPQLIWLYSVSRGVTCHDVNDPWVVAMSCRSTFRSGTHVDGAHQQLEIALF